jgi:hypothetical protein
VQVVEDSADVSVELAHFLSDTLTPFDWSKPMAKRRRRDMFSGPKPVRRAAGDAVSEFSGGFAGNNSVLDIKKICWIARRSRTAPRRLLADSVISARQVWWPRRILLSFHPDGRRKKKVGADD